MTRGLVGVIHQGPQDGGLGVGPVLLRPVSVTVGSSVWAVQIGAVGGCQGVGIGPERAPHSCLRGCGDLIYLICFRRS